MIMKQYTLEDLKELYGLPMPELIYRAQTVHREHHDPSKVELCGAQSIKTGGCPEDCAFCPQSAHYDTVVGREVQLEPEAVIVAAKRIQASGGKRMCLGGAWGRVPKGGAFEKVLSCVRAVKDLGLEVCCSLGTIDEEQVGQLLEAGCGTYNYNLDTAPEYYDKVITTRTYEYRYQHLKKIQAAGIAVCCGGILGMGESVEDRLRFLLSLAELDPQPESVPLNQLVASPGTPLAEQSPINPFEYVRIVAIARIILPKSKIGMAAGRDKMSHEMQALCFMAGANSIHFGGKILTVPTPAVDTDFAMLGNLGLQPA